MQPQIAQFVEVSTVLANAYDVDREVVEEYRDEIELARLAPSSNVFARGLLASTKDLIRTLAENALMGLKLYRDGLVDRLGSEFREHTKLLPTELRKKSIWIMIGVGFDLFLNHSAVLLGLAAQFPTQLGWIPAFLKALRFI